MLGEWLHTTHHHPKPSNTTDPLSLGQLAHFKIHYSANT